MNWSSILQVLVSFVAGGGLVTLVTLRTKKQTAEADLESKVSAEWKKLYEEMKTKADKVDETWQALVKLQGRVAKIQAELAVARSMRCEVLDCPHRMPPIKVQDADFNDVEDIEINLNDDGSH